MQKHKHLSNHNTWNTYGRRILFIINNGKSSDYNPTPETRTPLQPKDSEFHCSKDFCIQSTSITLLSKSILNTLPRACIYMEEIRQFRRLRRLRQLRGLMINGLTNLRLSRVFMFNYLGTYLQVCRRTTREWFTTMYKRNPRIHGFTTCYKGDSRVVYKDRREYIST